MFSIKAKIREKKDSRESLKEKGEIPAVFYGSKEKATSISIILNDFKKVWSLAGMSSTITLLIDKKKLEVLINDIQFHPITSEPIHVDFLVVDANKPVVISVPVDFIGISPAVKSGLGILVKVLREIEIEALPKYLPQSVSVDISILVDLDSQIIASDIKLPNEVSLITDKDEVIASIAPQEEEKEIDVNEIDLSKISVEKKGKKEEETV